MKSPFTYIIFLLMLASCSTTKKIRTNATSILKGKDTAMVDAEDTLQTAAKKLLYQENGIPFQTFSAKVKVQYEDSNGRQPDVNAFVRVIRDSAVWVSVTATFLNYEGFRILITPDSVFVMNKLENTSEQYPFSYINRRISAPVNFKDVQEFIAGKAAGVGDSISEVKSDGSFLQILLSFKNIDNAFYYTLPQLLLAKQITRVSQPGENYSAHVLYEDYVKTDSGYFSTSRDIVIPEKQEHIILSFKQMEFNKELSLPFRKPGVYTVK